MTLSVYLVTYVRAVNTWTFARLNILSLDNNLKPQYASYFCCCLLLHFVYYCCHVCLFVYCQQVSANILYMSYVHT